MFELPHSNTPHTRTHAPKIAPKRRTPETALAYAEIDGVGMGRRSDGTPYLTQRGLAALCGVQNAHIGTISRDWQTDKPRILAIKARLADAPESAHRELLWNGHRQYGYDAAVCEAIIDYYALAAGDHIQAEAQASRLRFKREDLATYILRQLAPPKAERPAPLRFVPLKRPQPEQHEAMDAAIAYICGLMALSVWLAGTYLDGLKQRALAARWNRLGLYLPPGAILEIQAEALLRMNATFRKATSSE